MTRDDSRLKDLPFLIPLEIPLDWSPEQALAAYEGLEELRTRIWLLYGADIQQFLRDTVPTSQPPARHGDPPF